MKLKTLLYVCVAFGNLLVQTTASATAGYGGMVGSDHELATEAGIKILKQGGNAADAALAVQWVLNVVRPASTGIGGGCFIVYYDSASNKVYTIDGREEAPDAYHPQIFCRDDACFPQPTDECDCQFVNQTIGFPENIFGGLSVGVPGTIHAFYNLFKHFGSNDVSWTDTFEDAISAGRNGFEMYDDFYTFLIFGLFTNVIGLTRFNESLHLYYNVDSNGNPTSPKANIGELFFNQDLADTFELLSTDPETAIDEFYGGSIAQDIVNAAQNAVNSVTRRYGLMTMDDISRYRSVFREPTVTEINRDDGEYVMYGMNMPSSGGATLAYIMNILNNLDGNDEMLSFLDSFGISDFDIYSSDVVHSLISMYNIAFADRNEYMGDSDFENVPIDDLLNPEYHKERGREYLSNVKIDTPIDFGIIGNYSSYGNEEHGTSHFFVVDKDNNIACVTTTIESVFGSGVTVPNRGFLLNNELTDFDSLGFDFINNKNVINGPEGGKKRRKTALNLFGLDDQNTFGGKRPRSSMSPTIIFEKIMTGESQSQSESKDSSSDPSSSSDDSSTVSSDDNSDYMLEPVLVVGSPGGSTIIGTVFQVASKVLLWDLDVQDAVDAKRVWSFNGDSVRIEKDFWRFNLQLRKELIELGYDVQNDFDNSTFINGRAAAVKFNFDPSGYANLSGAVDETRSSAVTVMAVCDNSDESHEICLQFGD